MNAAFNDDWTVISGIISWTTAPRAGSVRPFMQESGVLAAFDGDEPDADHTEIAFRCAVDDDGRLATVSLDGELRHGVPYAEFVGELAETLEATVMMQDISVDAEPVDSQEPAPEDVTEEVEEFEDAVPTVVVGKFSLSELVLAASSWGEPLKYLDEGQWRIVLVPDVSVLTWQNWEAASRPVAALTSFGDFKTLEIWGGGRRRARLGSDFWHAWVPAPHAALELPAAATPGVHGAMSLILAVDVPETDGLSTSLGLNADEEEAFRETLARPLGDSTLAGAAAALGFPARAGALAEGTISLDDVAGFLTVPSHPLPRALAETMVIPSPGNSPLARLHRAVLARPQLLVAASAVSATAAVVLSSVARQGGGMRTGARGMVRAGGAFFAADAATSLFLYAIVRSTKKP